jgi:hypothetical protein
VLVPDLLGMQAREDMSRVVETGHHSAGYVIEALR